eukprot:4832842-Prymnesium_polylepis.1
MAGWIRLPPPPAQSERWIACERCSKWRRLGPRAAVPGPGWHCGLGVDLARAEAACNEPEEAWDETDEAWKLREPFPELGEGWFK